MIRSKICQRIAGLAFFLFGAGGTAYCWHLTMTEGSDNGELDLLCPTLALAGLGMCFFPFDYERLRTDHGVDQVESFHQMPGAWKGLLVLTLLVALINWVAASQCRARVPKQPEPQVREPAAQPPVRDPKAFREAAADHKANPWKSVLLFASFGCVLVGCLMAIGYDMLTRGTEVLNFFTGEKTPPPMRERLVWFGFLLMAFGFVLMFLVYRAL